MKNKPKKIQLKTYSDHGVSEKNPSVDNVVWTKFKIVVASEEDKLEIKNSLKYFHDLREINTQYVTINQLVHEYLDSSNIVVDYDLYRRIEQQTCVHPVQDRIIQDGIHYCKNCWKALKFTTRHKD